MSRFTLIFQSLKAQANPARAAGQRRFFKTGPGEYGYGDKFLGLTLPQTRALAQKWAAQAGEEDLEKLFASPWHEARALAALLLVRRFEMSKAPEVQKRVFDYYVAH